MNQTLEDEINQSMVDLEQALADVNVQINDDDLEQALADVQIDDDDTSKDSSVRETSLADGPSPDIRDNLEDPVGNRPMPKRLLQYKFMFGIGLFAIILAAIPILLFALNNFSITTTSGLRSSDLKNDMCSQAFPLETGMLPLVASTAAAKLENDEGLKSCGLDLDIGPGIWFEVTGTGVPFKLIKHDEQSFTNHVSVYQGECGDLTCVAGDDLKGTIFWNTLKGQQYYILVSGVENTVGQFSIALEDVPQAPDNVAVNDMCDGALGLAMDGSFTRATTESATFDIEGAGSCYRAAHAGPGLWYQVIGSGRPLQASTNNPDTYVAIFAGACDMLECVASSDISKGNQVSVQWEAEQGTRYYILVHSAGTSKGTSFEISVSDDFDDQLVVNDFCRGAIGPIASDGSILVGSTENATLDTSGAGDCYDDELTGNGLWYAVHGTGQTLRIVTTETSKITPLVTVFKGSCDGLECMASHDEVTMDQRSAVSWESDVEETYYLLVRGTDHSRGDFELKVMSLAEGQDPTVPVGEEQLETPLEPAINDYCDSALDLPIDGSLTSGSTENATKIMDGIGRCHSQVNNGPGVWYRAVGNGQALRVATSEVSNLDAFISVYSGDCEDLFCTADIDGDTRPKREFVWDTNSGESYFILVQGLFGQKGAFDIRVENADASSGEISQEQDQENVDIPQEQDQEDVDIDAVIENASCASATTLANSADTMLTASTENGKVSQVTRSGSCSSAANIGPGLWWKVLGTGSPIKVLTNDLSASETLLSVYEGSCDGLVCVNSDDDTYGADKDNGVWFISKANTVYYLHVHSVGEAAGPFELSVEYENDESSSLSISDASTLAFICENAVGPLLISDPELNGDTSTANFANVGSHSCFSGLPAGPGVFYHVLGTGSAINVTTSKADSFNPLISVYSGSTCNGESIQCIDGEFKATTSQNSMEWQSILGLDYYILVHGVRDTTGPFSMKVDGLSQATTATDSPTYAPTESPTESPTVESTPLATEATNSAPSDSSGSFRTGENDVCEKAIGPLPPTSRFYGAFLSGATVDNVQSCGTATNTDPGIWYTVEGTGARISVSTCENPDGKKVSTSVSVFKDGCGSLTCLVGSSDTCADDGMVVWDSEFGATYHVLITGDEKAQASAFQIVIDKN